MHLQERPDIAMSIMSRISNDGLPDKVSTMSSQVALCDQKQPGEGGSQPSELRSNSLVDKAKESCTIPDLSKDGLLTKLRWTGSKKRSQPSSSSSGKSFPSPVASSSPCESSFMIPSSMKMDHDNCKYMGDSLFNSSVVPPLSSLVMSR